jgi:hypothetical protein
MRNITNLLRSRLLRLQKRSVRKEAASFWHFAAAVIQGRHDEAEALWLQLPEETRALLVEVPLPADPLAYIEERINAPLLSNGIDTNHQRVSPNGNGQR